MVAACAACGSDDSSLCASDVRFIPVGTPTFLAARDVGNGSGGGSGSAWQLPALQSDGTYHICATQQVEIVEVCEHADGSFTDDEFLALASEVSEVSGSPCNVDTGSGSDAGSGSATIVTVTGSVSAAGIVGIGDAFEVGSSAPWDYSLDVPTGTYDVIASTGIDPAGSGSGSDGSDGSGSAGSDSGLLAIARGVTFGSDTALDVDLAAGVPLQPVKLGLVNAGSDALTVEAETVYATETSEATIAVTRDGTALIAPQTAVAPNEAQILTVIATDATDRQQTLQAPFGAAPNGSATFEMLGPLDMVSFGSGTPESVTWDVLPGFTNLQLDLVAGGGLGAGSAADPVSIQRVTASASWQGMFKVTTLAFDTSAPGFQAKWNIDTSQPFGRELEVELDSSAETLTTAVISVVGAPAAVVPSWRGAARAAGFGDRGIVGVGAPARGRARGRRP
jgi:hypothetical protein